MRWWHPEHFIKKQPYLEQRARIISSVRDFFQKHDYIEIETPTLQTAPCMEAHIQAFQVEQQYLHTSPEFAMKKVLVASGGQGSFSKIFQLARVYRQEAPSRWHAPEFTMLEWYQAGTTYKDMMEETIALLRHVCPDLLQANAKTSTVNAPWQKLTFIESLQRYAALDISTHLGDQDHIRAAAQQRNIHLSDHDDWDNSVLKIFMHVVEPNLGSPVPTIIYDYPISMAALSQPKKADPRFAERFEVYICGVELCNAFGELTDPDEQRRRFYAETALRKALYDQDYPVDEDFLSAIAYGLPPCAGNALGIDRLIMLATHASHIHDVQI